MLTALFILDFENFKCFIFAAQCTKWEYSSSHWA